MQCPKCSSENVTIQRERTGSVGAGSNKVVIEEPKKSHGCFYWVFVGWWWKPIYFIFVGWWKNLLFGRKKKGGINVRGEKDIYKTVAVCQDCGHTWKV